MIVTTDKIRNGTNTVILYDGRIKDFQSLLHNDILMGDDSTPRNILSIQVKSGKLFKITPQKGDPFICEEFQGLSLKRNKQICISRSTSKPTAKKQEDRICVNWVDINGVKKFNSFSVGKYTLERAIKLAEDLAQDLTLTGKHMLILLIKIFPWLHM